MRENESKGILILVAGPSGAGKDTLIEAARRQFSGQPDVHFPMRIITRKGSPAEDNRKLTQAQFDAALGAGDFFLSWRAHGLSYALGRDVRMALENGDVVVANISRQVIGEAFRRWPRAHFVHVTASREILRQRLMARGREGTDDIERRIARRADFDLPPGVTYSEIDNSGDLAEAADQFIDIVSNYLASP